MRSLAAGGRLTVRLDWAAASLPRPTSTKTIAAAAATVTAAPAIASRRPTLLRIPTQVIEPKRLYHANIVKTNLSYLRRDENPQIFMMFTICNPRLRRLRRGSGD